jgi:hypothetical protein
MACAHQTKWFNPISCSYLGCTTQKGRNSGAFRIDAVGEFTLLVDFRRQTGVKLTGFIGFNKRMPRHIWLAIYGSPYMAKDRMEKAKQGFELEKWIRFDRKLS